MQRRKLSSVATPENPKGFNPAALRVIDFLVGDRSSGMCMCPCHDDGANPSLSVSNGDKVAVVLHCFGRKSRQHDLEVIEYLKRRAVWPSSDKLYGEQASVAADAARSPEERRRYALDVWNSLAASNGREIAQKLLPDYLTARGLTTVPETAMATIPFRLWPRGDGETRLRTEHCGMVLPIRDKTGELQGIQVTWLDWSQSTEGEWLLDRKREEEPQRQSYGIVSGNFVD
jgi:hypothetical protein